MNLQRIKLRRAPTIRLVGLLTLVIIISCQEVETANLRSNCKASKCATSTQTNASTPSPKLANPSDLQYTVGTTIADFSFVNTGEAAVSCSVSPSLPSGLSLSVASGTCKLSGTPGISQVATIHTVTATAANGYSGTAAAKILISAQPVVATPQFSVAEGTYNTAQSVTVSTTTSGADIRYTTDGSTPNCTSSSIATAALNIATTQTVKIIGCKATFADSIVATSTYTINLTNYWVSMTQTNAPSARFNHSAVRFGSKLIIWGGQDANTSAALNTGKIYDPTSDTWTNMTTSGAPSARYGHSAVWSNARMFIWGGRGASGSLGNGAWYDPTSDTWTNLAVTDAPAARHNHTTLLINDEVVIWGGATYTAAACMMGTEDCDVARRDGATYEPSSNMWFPMTTAPVGYERYLAAGGVDSLGRAIFYGGFTYGPNFDAETVITSLIRYDFGGGSWSSQTTSGSSTQNCFAAFAFTADKLLSWAGASVGGDTCALGSTRIFDGGEYLNFDSSTTWSSLTNSNAPSSRAGHTGTIMNSKYYVWGGYQKSPYNLVNTGAVYNPSNDTWTTMSTTNAPTARRNHTTTAAGTRLFVWGGISTPVTQQGAIYYP